MQLRSVYLRFLVSELSSVTWSSLNKFYFSFMRQPFKYLRRAVMSLPKSIFQDKCAKFLHPFVTGPAFRTLLHLPLWLRPWDDLPLSRGAPARLDSGRCVLNTFSLLPGPILSIFVKILLSSLGPCSNTVECGLRDRHCAGAGRTLFIYLTSFFRAVLGSQ